MKSRYLSLFLLAFAFQLSAQKTLVTENAQARATTDRLVELYQLDANQQSKVYEIQVRKAKQLTQISTLENSDPNLYLKKMSALQRGNEGSIKLLLNRDQLKSYQLNFLKLREKRAAKAKAMKESGASELAIEKALLQIEQ